MLLFKIMAYVAVVSAAAIFVICIRAEVMIHDDRRRLGSMDQ